MIAIALGDDAAQFAPLVSWYRERPTQVAFATSLILHALLIALIPGFRAVPDDTRSVLSVRIVSEQAPWRAAPEVSQSLQQSTPVAAPLPPELVAPLPQPHVIEQTPPRLSSTLTQPEVPVLRQPEGAALEQVARAELAPTVRREKPDVRPVISRQPELAPVQPTAPTIVTEPEAQVAEPVRPSAEFRPQRRAVRQRSSFAAESGPQPDLMAPQATAPAQTAQQTPPPVAITPAVPTPPQSAPAKNALPLTSPNAPPGAAVAAKPTAPRADVAPPVVPATTLQRRPTTPVERAEPQLSAVAKPAVTAVSVKPSAPAPLTGPAPAVPASPAAELVEPSVLEAYRQSVSREVMRHMQYPRIAVQRKWQGKTVVEMQLSADGSVTGMAIAESSGKTVLDEAALKMVKQSLPLPKPPPGVRTVKVPVVFRLQG